MKTAWGCTALMVAMIAAVGCGGDSGTTTDDMGNTVIATTCTANQKSCLNDRTAVVCTADGKALVAVACTVTQKCDTGNCVADPAAACTAAQNTCQDANTALRCSATGAGFDVVTCPTGTTCGGVGLCSGAVCTVGTGSCFDQNTVNTCADGSSYTTMTCPSGQTCVSNGSYAACKPADCLPDPNGCNLFCGNKGNPMAPNQASTLSTCTPTPNGYKWISLECPGGASCDPSASTCGNGGHNASCSSSQCTPGDTRCADSLGYQTCGTDGHWSATVTACNASVTSAKYTCFTRNSAPNQAVCGDIVCEGDNTGACDDAGLFHACGTDGKVAATGTACTTGVCTTTNNENFGIWNPGSCRTQCSEGDEQCVGGSTFVACNNGVWGVPQQCAGGKNCQQSNTNNHPRKTCGDCVPGDRECGGTSGQQIAVCGTDSTWGAFSDCTTGTCSNVPNGPPVCLAQCVPGTKLCAGTTSLVPGVNIDGTSADRTCTAKGVWADPVDCGAGTYCRHKPGQNGDGPSVGCVACVGTQNEHGFVDSKCSSADGTAATGNYIVSCKPDSSGYDAADAAMCVAPTTDCQPPAPQYCHNWFLGMATATNIENYFGASFYNCQYFFGTQPVSCGVQNSTSTVPDCCSNFCEADSNYEPPFCSNPGN